MLKVEEVADRLAVDVRWVYEHAGSDLASCCMEEMGRGRIVGPDQESLTFEDLATVITNEYEAK